MALAAFMRVIKADPDADTPRLVFADWLDEQGETDRAEFIRLHVRWSRLPAERESSARRARLDELYTRNVRAWLGPWIDMGLEELWPTSTEAAKEEQGWRSQLWWDRGLLRVRVGLTNLLAATPRLPAEAWEWVESLTLTDPHPTALAALVEQSWLSQLGRFTLRNFRSAEGLGDIGAQIFARATHFSTLAELRVPTQGLSAASIGALAASTWLPQVQTLILDYNSIGDVGGSALAEVPWQRLRTLGLRGCELSDATALALASQLHLTTLRRLDLYGNNIGNLGALALGEAETLQSLERLDLSDNRINTPTRSALKHNFGARVVLI